MLEIIATEWGGYVLRPKFEYEFERVEWEHSEEAQLHIFVTEYGTRYKAKQAAIYNGYELCA